MLALAARDIHKLATSGLLREWGQRADTLLRKMGGRTSAGVRESVESAKVETISQKRGLSIAGTASDHEIDSTVPKDRSSFLDGCGSLWAPDRPQ